MTGLPGVSVSLDLTLRGGGDIAARIGAAADAGAAAVELWGWRAYDASRVADALRTNDIPLLTVCPDPEVSLTTPLGAAERRIITESVDAAARWRARAIVVQSGRRLPGLPDAEQERIVADNLAAIAEAAAVEGLSVLLEPVESRRIRPGILIDTAEAGARVVRKAAHPGASLLLDLYHERTMNPRGTDDFRGLPLGHVQVADVPGRGAPGSGVIDWAGELTRLHASGYRGLLGLECAPPESLGRAISRLRALLAESPYGSAAPAQTPHTAS